MQNVQPGCRLYTPRLPCDQSSVHSLRNLPSQSPEIYERRTFASPQVTRHHESELEELVTHPFQGAQSLQISPAQQQPTDYRYKMEQVNVSTAKPRRGESVPPQVAQVTSVSQSRLVNNMNVCSSSDHPSRNSPGQSSEIYENKTFASPQVTRRHQSELDSHSGQLVRSSRRIPAQQQPTPRVP